jgi:methionyl-tRNA formyltransferase
LKKNKFMTSKFVFLSEKEWHKVLFNKLTIEFSNINWLFINKKADFNLKLLNEFNPDKIFIPHWSYIIPEDIFSSFECIVFHMTDLPFGRGGSPLQNLILRGFKSTKISAIKVQLGVDTGDVYLKKPLDLSGSAQEIFHNSTIVIEEMIKEIISEKLVPSPQLGEIVKFKRRLPEESNLCELEELLSIYNHIRMLDCEGYPPGFIETKFFKFEFTKAAFNESDKVITANVRIIKK